MLTNFNICEGIASRLSRFRSPVYGVAALLIILFHATGPVKEDWLWIFRHGYIGVDMYLMIGAFCLCYSFKKHSLKQFYLNRFLRIYPLWFFVCNLRTVYLLLTGGDVEWLKLIWGSTVVMPLLTGRGSCDWFTASILILYLAFPALYRVVMRYNSSMVFLLSTILSITAMYIYPVHSWQLACLFCRIPVFVLGIILYKQTQVKENVFPILLTLIAGFIYAVYADHMFLLTSMACPFFVALLLYLFKSMEKCRFSFIATKPLTYLGNRSLECYYGGWYTYLWNAYYSIPVIGLIVYIGQTLMGMFLLNQVNVFFNKKLFKKYIKH